MCILVFHPHAWTEQCVTQQNLNSGCMYAKYQVCNVNAKVVFRCHTAAVKSTIFTTRKTLMFVTAVATALYSLASEEYLRRPSPTVLSELLTPPPPYSCLSSGKDCTEQVEHSQLQLDLSQLDLSQLALSLLDSSQLDLSQLLDPSSSQSAAYTNTLFTPSTEVRPDRWWCHSEAHA